jgi:hypothetical protein
MVFANSWIVELSKPASPRFVGFSLAVWAAIVVVRNVRQIKRVPCKARPNSKGFRFHRLGFGRNIRQLAGVSSILVLGIVGAVVNSSIAAVIAVAASCVAFAVGGFQAYPAIWPNGKRERWVDKKQFEGWWEDSMACLVHFLIWFGVIASLSFAMGAPFGNALQRNTWRPPVKPGKPGKPIVEGGNHPNAPAVVAPEPASSAPSVAGTSIPPAMAVSAPPRFVG